MKSKNILIHLPSDWKNKNMNKFTSGSEGSLIFYENYSVFSGIFIESVKQ